MPENRIAWEIIGEMDSGMFDSWGGFNSDLMRFAFETWNIEGDERWILYRKIMVYVAEVRAYIAEKQKNG